MSERAAPTPFDPWDDGARGGAGYARVDDSKTEAPAPGIYAGTPAATYHGWDACSNSRLADLVDRSPAFCLYNARVAWDAHPSKPSLQGTATHVAILEPDHFDARFVVATGCAAETKDKKPCSNAGSILRSGRWYCGIRGHAPEAVAEDANEKRLVIPSGLRDDCLRMRDAVWADDEAKEFLANALREVSLVWTDEPTGLRCKARLDGWDQRGRVVTDLKTTSNGGTNERAWARIVNSQGYYRQGPWYLDGAAEVAPLAKVPTPETFVFVVVEDSAPYEVAVYELDDETILAGRFELEAAKNRYARCRLEGSWPGKVSGVPKIGIPEWRKRDLLPRDLGDWEA